MTACAPAPRLALLSCPNCATPLRPARAGEVLLFCGRCPSAVELDADRLVPYPVAAMVAAAGAYVPSWGLVVQAKVERFEASAAAETPIGRVARAGDLLEVSLQIPALGPTHAAVAQATATLLRRVQTGTPTPGVPIVPGTRSFADALAITRFVLVSAIAGATGTVKKLKLLVEPTQVAVLLGG